MKILHKLPGRIRLFVPQLWRKEDAIILESYLKDFDGILKCSVNQRRSSVLLIYDDKRIQVEQVIPQIEFIMQCLQSSQASEKYSLLAQIANGQGELKARETGAAGKVIVFGIIYLLYKWKQAKFGKFAPSRSVAWLQAASLVTNIGGYSLFKSYYKKYSSKLPGDSEDILKQTSVFFTLIRESARGAWCWS